MRRLLLILITLGLSWAATDCTCRMSGAASELACCCHSGVAHPCPQPRNCISDAALNGSSNSYCSAVTSNTGTAGTSQAENLTVTDRPLLGTFAVHTAARPLPIRLPTPSHLVVRAGNTSPIYLLFGRLLR